MIEAGNLRIEGSADFETFVFRPKARAEPVVGVVAEGLRGRGFDVGDLVANTWNVLVEGVEGRVDKILLARFVRFVGKVRPVFVIRVGARDDVVAIRAGARLRIVEGVGAAGDMASLCGTRERRR